MRIRLTRPHDVDSYRIGVGAGDHKVPALVVRPKPSSHGSPGAHGELATQGEPEFPGVPGVVWIHGGGYVTGMKEMVYMSRGLDLVENFGAVVISPGYRLAVRNPYPAAIDDCYACLLYLKEHAQELGVNPAQIMVGGESAGGGLAAALCIMARDRGEVSVAFQMPLYPMLDNLDTPSSKDNHGRIWNTRRNHLGWGLYLRDQAKSPTVSPYAAAARATDYSHLPPAYTFVGDGEPFHHETLAFVDALVRAGVEASADVFHTDIHAFDMLEPQLPASKQAIQAFNEHFAYAAAHYFAPQS